MQELFRFINMPQYGWKCEDMNMPQHVWIYNNRKCSEYVSYNA